MTSDADQIILIVYCVLLLAGGAMGLIKAGSKASIIASTIFAVILLLFVIDVFPLDLAWTVLAFLVLFFGMRFAKGRKFMPNGMMLVLTAVTLVATLLV